ncbi:MAG: asparagine synthase (glutamine-hydrolyzing) [Ignavibacteriae bacterium]|nr:asparagine synthase (glutamine-hydrolyzing) [Ignavibacteriota bacterium]
MCGIAGYIEFSKDGLCKGRPYELLDRMIDTINHRGPDDFGMSFHGYGLRENISESSKVNLYPDDKFTFAFGHRRLSIIDLSENGRQPMTNRDKSVEVNFNGEIYNYIELREELSKDRQFYTETDTEVIIASYEKWGTDMLGKFDGMFAFTLYDRNEQKIICARDPVGIKPFYYNCSKKGFVFGSEPRTVLTGLDINGSIDKVRTSEFLIMGITDFDEGTFYSEVSQLPGGCYLEVDICGEMKGPFKYWTPPIDIFGGKHDFVSETKENIFTSVKRQLRADVCVGTSLSGGIDSGTIVSTAGEVLKNGADNYNTLTFSYPGFEDDESRFAFSIAEHSGMRWNPVIPAEEDLSSDLKKMIIAMGEPFSTLSMFAQYKVMEKASDMGIKVMLDGQGGDEVYLGYPRVAQRVIIEYLKKFKLSSFFREWIGLKKHASVSLSRSLFGNVFFRSPSVAVNRNINRLKQYASEELLSHYRDSVANEVYSADDIFAIQNNELTKYCLPRLLRYADRNSMAFGVESRVPHLSKIMLDYALRLPLDWRVRNGWTKYSVRKAMEGKLPKEILWSNQKKGFPVPQKFWVEKLRNSIEETLLSRDELGKFINIDNVISSIENGRGEEAYLWRAISVGMWISLMGVKI